FLRLRARPPPRSPLLPYTTLFRSVLGRERVDLMLLDIDLPFIDGHSLLQAVREKGIEIPAIVISGLPGEEPEVRALEIGAVDFRSEEHTSELQSRGHLVCRLLLEK